ncbi:MAG: hypothetical protein H0Z33_00435 [Bacillaceae bacterium]|nr:hypothetical protein [Bacillaceae bacterium]
MTFKKQLFFGILMVLAVIGLVNSLLYNLSGVIFMFALAALVVFVIHRFSGRRSAGVDSKYQQAVRRQKQQMKQKKKAARSRKNIPFQVIDGNKGKTEKKKYLH